MNVKRWLLFVLTWITLQLFVIWVFKVYICIVYMPTLIMLVLHCPGHNPYLCVKKPKQSNFCILLKHILSHYSSHYSVITLIFKLYGFITKPVQILVLRPLVFLIVCSHLNLLGFCLIVQNPTLGMQTFKFIK